MIKVLATALSLASFLNMLDAQGYEMEDVFYKGAELNRIQKRSTFDRKKVSIWLGSAKTNNDDAIVVLEKLGSHEDLKSKLNSVNELLDEISTLSADLLWTEIRNVLWHEADVLKDMLSVYETTPAGLNRNKFLNAIYHAAGACIDLTIALAEAISDRFQKADVSVKADQLRKRLHSAERRNSDLPERVLELAENVLKRTEIR